jgi:hypothetical protein
MVEKFEEIKSLIESATTDEDVKIGLCKILDTPGIDVKDTEVKTFMRKYTKEILEIKEVNQEFIDGKRPDLPYHS